MNLKSAITLAIAFGITAAFADDPKPAATLPPAATKTGLIFATDIKPIFATACLRCHTTGKRPGAGLTLDTLEGALKGSKDGKVIIPGDSAKSDLVLSVAHIGDDPDMFMPRGKNAKKLSDEQIGLIRAWIDQGAK